MVRVAPYFSRLISQLTPSEAEYAAARRRRDTVAQRTKVEGLIEVLYSGSYAKRTCLRPLKDIDLFLGLDPDAYPKQRERVLTRLQFQLRSSFPSSVVRLQTHSVGVIFQDGFRVDLVPGFAMGEEDGFYEIWNRKDRRWLPTSIALHKQFFEIRQDRDGRYRDMIRLVKHWRNSRRSSYSSFLFEMFVAKAFEDGIPGSFEEASYHFFDWLSSDGLEAPIWFDDFYEQGGVDRNSAPLVVLDPAHPSNNVASAVSATGVRELKSAARRARWRCRAAMNARSEAEMGRHWKEVYPRFPRRIERRGWSIWDILR